MSVSADAINVYEALRRRGYDVQEAPGTYTFKEGKANNKAGYVYEVRPPAERPVLPVAEQETPPPPSVAPAEVGLENALRGSTREMRLGQNVDMVLDPHAADILDMAPENLNKIRQPASEGVNQSLSAPDLNQ
jgi:hypothetical protein